MFLFNDENMMTRIDMSEYQETSTACRGSSGAPPGYVGYEEGGQLDGGRKRRKPYSVVLLRRDREGASRRRSTSCLQVLDDGRLTDNKGRTVDFTQHDHHHDLEHGLAGSSMENFAAAAFNEGEILAPEVVEKTRRSR